MTPNNEPINRSSKNATKHGFTGRELVLRPEEKEPYEAHVAAYLADYNPATHRQTQLVRQLIDLDWSLHQISIEQSNTMLHMNAITSLPPDPANPAAIVTALAPLSRILTNLNLYEVRRRRASKAVAEELAALQKSDSEKQAQELQQASQLYKSYKATGKTFDPAEYGFVCSLDDILAYLDAKEASGQTIEPQADPIPPEVMASFLKVKAEIEAEMRSLGKEVDGK
jgi:hypothetical protein